ncbi:sushi, von Willebrand factor type A, EGF and pentraxin domain-containing protein 1-like [Corticium candelabrum]|uniref:sushi, von Willebrand factor type A, EGF and pentraxin domain-containing protein 1-like n=1 Tax=Corticium candelabrum TaxID=121492 RepID=UPI002E26B5E6|nr:sushi, von Willebrand factor type A, EGF and pentraxin domain-containing protein 1-like [Corticium candelabrum]
MTSSIVAVVVLCFVGSSLSDGGYKPPPVYPPKCPTVPSPSYGYVKIIKDRCRVACNCPKLRSPPYGSVSISNYGCKATYKCNQYYKLTGSYVRTCSYRTWKPAEPKCVRVCPWLPHPQYGWVKVIGTTAKYGCNKQYKLVGSSSRNCYRGRWGGQAPKCVRECPNLPKPAYGWVNIDDDKATYGCNKGYKLIGSKIRYCRYGRWYGLAPKCVPDCPKLSNPTYGWVKIVGNKAQYGCRYGYNLVGSTYRYCHYGKWAGVAPKCVRRCPRLYNPPYGSVSVFGSKASYSCRYGYKLIGLKYRYCKNGVWGGAAPKCIKYCPAPIKPAYGWVRVVGNKASYGCNRGYNLVGSATRYCYSGIWKPAAPRCIKHLVCPYLPHPPYGKVKIVGNKATYYCNDGYYLSGSSYCYCSYGRWNCKRPTCSPHKHTDVY